MGFPFRLLLRPDIALEVVPRQALLSSPAGILKIPDPGEPLLAALRTLAGGGAREAELAGRALEAGGTAAVAQLYRTLAQLRAIGGIAYGVPWDGGAPDLLVPSSPGFRFDPDGPPPPLPARLSRFAYLHAIGSEVVLESPLAHGRLILRSPEGLSLVGRSAGGIPDLPSDGGDAAHRGAGLLMLLGCGFLASPDEEREPLDHWDFHDLLFHARSRPGRHANPLGANFRFLGKKEPVPALKPPGKGARIGLSRPDLEALLQTDAPFTLVLEERRSVKEYDREKPISLRALGEFLFRSARVKRASAPDPERGVPYETTRRPYPGGGAGYELETYAVVSRCGGLDEGLYRYDPGAHELEIVSGGTEHTRALLKDAWRASGYEPQVLLVLAARFRRLSWKYDSIAYSVVLKDVGALLQTFYLVATAMDLGGCALGSGDPDRFCLAAGTDYAEESSVGEFMLGSKRLG